MLVSIPLAFGITAKSQATDAGRQDGAQKIIISAADDGPKGGMGDGKQIVNVGRQSMFVQALSRNEPQASQPPCQLIQLYLYT